MTSGRNVFWRSLEEKESPARLHEEASGSDVVKQTVDARDLTRLRRRQFLTLSGAISTLASVEGCIRRPVEKIMPYTDAPQDVTVGVPLHYASVLSTRGEALGVLVQAYEGRPTKVEGNPDHPASGGGATDMQSQAAVLDLYDGDRAKTPTLKGETKTAADVDAALAALAGKLASTGGRGLHVLAEPTLSPTFLRVRKQLQEKLPNARFHTYAPVNDANERAGTKLAFGRPLLVNHRLTQAKVIVALDSDFLMTESGSTVAAREFADGRHMASASDKEPNRLYVVEPSMSVTGSNADHRLPLPAASIGGYVKALAAALGRNGVSLGALGPSLGGELPGVPKHWVDVVARELAAHKGESVVIVGSRQPAAVHALAHAMNAALGNAGKTVTYTAPVDADEPDHFTNIAGLARDMASGQVQTLVVLGGNPAYDAPADTQFKRALGKVPLSICLSSYRHETGAACTWHIPRAHELESWGDHVSRNGTYAVQQPLIAPVFDGRTDVELLAALLGSAAGSPERDAHQLVKATAAERGAADELSWQRLLQKGASERNDAQVLGVMAVQEAQVGAALSALPAAKAPSNDALEVVFLADNKLFDGRYTNNVWLLELPDPITRITWDNAALIGPGTAKALGIKNGDMVRLSGAGGATIDIVAWIQAGQAPGSIGLPLGWGRLAELSHVKGVGFDVYPLRSSAAPHFAGGVQLKKLGATYPISQTQEHDVMEGRPLAIDANVEEYKSTPDFGQWATPDQSSPPLWKRQDYSKGHQWGMTIDLNRCSGCNACVIACQAENNIPVVGKDQVARGREMHWLRIDRYYLGDDADNPEVAFQPVGCQHCEEAPCENVCPVNATSHSPEGLNDIAYNRCIGTRYCMNNCPYKVRRFNFLNFNLDIPESQKMVFNPSVTLRFRGVIEKCSYCVQRIQNAKIAAKRDKRELRDGDVTSACQQACAAQAISFGDINDPNSAVSKARATDRNYALLADVGTRPRTRFLGKIRNPNPEMKG